MDPPPCIQARDAQRDLTVGETTLSIIKTVHAVKLPRPRPRHIAATGYLLLSAQMLNSFPGNSEYTIPKMNSEEITRTVKLKLETSNTKNQKVREKIEEWQNIADRISQLLPTFPEYRWGDTNDSHLFRLVKNEFPDHDLKAHTAYEAAYKVTEAFGSWKQRGKEGENPRGRFGDANYMRFAHDDFEIESNENGYGVKIGLEPYNAEWFHVNAGDYQREYLSGLTEGEMDNGSGELHLHDKGELFLHLTAKWEVDVLDMEEVDNTVGVDLGESVLYTAAVVNGEEVLEVEMETGQEFRHYRERLERKREKAMEKGDLRGVKESKGDRERYTEHITDVASRRIVDLAKDHQPSAILLEDLKHYRETAEDPIHDWPFAKLQEKILYKATEEGIPAKKVDPSYTSITCRKCGSQDSKFRNGDDFQCLECGYEVHADVNAAINIAYSE